MHGAHEVVGSNPAGPTTTGSAPTPGARTAGKRHPLNVAAPDGLLPVQHLKRMVRDGRISATTEVDGRQLQPASLDLRLASRAWRVRASFLPGPTATVTERLRDMAMHEIDLSRAAALETGCVYVAALQERLRLGPSVSALANAKSTTGRLDVFTRLIADHCSEFDRLPPGYEGPLYAEISPRAFSLLVRSGSRLNQIRLSRGDPQLTGDALARLHAESPLVDLDANIDSEGLRISVDLDSEDGAPIGYRAKRHCGLVDIDERGAYRIGEFWDPIAPRDGELVLDPGAFYVLVSRESVRIPPGFAAEMSPYLPFIGEFRVHYAGFFDPGFGYGLPGDAGARSVLEVRCHETPFVLRHGQVVGRLKFEKMLDVPEAIYGTALGSSYQGQGLLLARQFRPD